LRRSGLNLDSTARFRAWITVAAPDVPHQLHPADSLTRLDEKIRISCGPRLLSRIQTIPLPTFSPRSDVISAQNPVAEPWGDLTRRGFGQAAQDALIPPAAIPWFERFVQVIISACPQALAMRSAVFAFGCQQQDRRLHGLAQAWRVRLTPSSPGIITSRNIMSNSGPDR